MADWTFEDALTAIQSPPSIPTSVLQSADGIHLGDVCFAKIHTTLWMRAMSLAILKMWVENGSFNPEHMAEANYSCSMAILLTLYPDAQCNDIESVGIGLIVCQCKALLGKISSIPHLIKYVYSLLEFERQSVDPIHRMYCMIVGNYGGHMAYAMDPPICMVYFLDFIKKDDPATMTFRNQENHPVSFTRDGLIICQLLVQDCTECEYVMTTHNGCFLIPRGVQFSKDLFPEIVVPHNHATPYHDPKTGKEAPFITMGPFSKKDMFFLGITGDLELFTTEEVMTLRNAGILKSSSGASLSLPKLSSLASLGQIQSAPATPKVAPHSAKVEPDSSSKRRDYTGSLKSHKCLVSVAAGSSASLEKSDEQDCDTVCRWHERSRKCENHAHTKGKSSHHKHTSGHDCGGASKHGRAAEPGSSLGHPHSKV